MSVPDCASTMESGSQKSLEVKVSVYWFHPMVRSARAGHRTPAGSGDDHAVTVDATQKGKNSEYLSTSATILYKVEEGYGSTRVAIKDSVLAPGILRKNRRWHVVLDDRRAGRRARSIAVDAVQRN